MNTITHMEREARFLAEAKNILSKGEWHATQIIISLMKDAGWEPDPDKPDGWVRR